MLADGSVVCGCGSLLGCIKADHYAMEIFLTLTLVNKKAAVPGGTEYYSHFAKPLPLYVSLLPASVLWSAKVPG